MRQFACDKISIIVISCNVENYLEECINSVRNQTYPNIEIILVDDGSVDRSADICDNFASIDSRVKVVHKQNGGLVSARQAGIKVATGNYVAFVDGDDWVDEDMYEKLYLLSRLYNADVILSGIVRELPEGARNDKNVMPVGYYDKIRLIKDVYPEMIYSIEKKCCIVDPSLCNKLFKMEIIKEVLLQVDERIFYWGEDAATTFPCLLKVDSIYVSEFCMYHHRIVTIKKDITYKNAKVFDRLLFFHKNLTENVKNTKYYDIMQFQINGYFLHLLNKAIRDELSLDIMEFYKNLFGSKEEKTYNRGYRFVLPIDKVRNYKNIILYGAGKVGKEYYKQLNEYEINIVAWIDKNSETYAGSGLDVKGIDEITKCKYDVIILAAKRKEIADSMLSDLLGQGYDVRKIIWAEPEQIL